MIDKILNSIKNIPAFPETVQRLMALLNREDYSVRDLAAVVRYDQAITANILRIANAAYFGLREKVKSIEQALALLGRQNLVRTIQTAGVSRVFRASSGQGYVSTGSELWQHSVAVALMSQILSRRIRGREDTVLYTAALLHDVGKMILGEYVQEAMTGILELVTNRGYTFLEAEEEILGINHAEIGGKIAEKWNYPEEIRDAIRYHHRPDLLSEAAPVPWFVYLSDQFTSMMGVDGGVDGLAYRGLEQVISMFQLRERDLETCFILLLQDMERAKDVMNIV